ncbi:MAG TPA: polysaccharide biosynthesis tyrosine autokinase [Chloroflexi bacterium]|nr:polysaccharide biosynthesis tyrosine autokinase [Chloroflexota bacterium]
MNLKSYLQPLLHYWWLLLAAVIVAAGTTFVVANAQPLTYQTRTTLVVGNLMYQTNPTGNDVYLAQQLANYYARIGMQAEVRRSVQAALDMNWLPQYTVNPLPNSQFIEIVVNDTNPVRAQAVANELASQLINYSPTSDLQQGAAQQEFINEQISYLEENIRTTLEEIEIAERALTETNSAQEILQIQGEISVLQTKLSQLQSNYAALVANTGQGAINTLSVIEPAPLTSQPIGPGKLMMTLIAGAAAGGIAAVAAYLLDLLDDTIKTAEDVTNALSLPVLGTIPAVKRWTGRRGLPNTKGFWGGVDRLAHKFRSSKEAVAMDSAESDTLSTAAFPVLPAQLSEDLRLVRINLGVTAGEQPIRILLVTSPSPDEGKSFIATHLAMMMAKSGKEVVLVDANFEQPHQEWIADDSDELGLTDLLTGSVVVSDILRTYQERLNVIGAGKPLTSPLDLSDSDTLSRMLSDLRYFSDVVIIDGPPLTFTNAVALSSKVDGVVVVVRHGFTRKGTAQKQVAKLKQVGANVLGAVLNKAPA